ncbi:hypothetical protein TWF718_001286 [Orbilia javanica]|uniref:Uncharacterized protein n=1 Tax=Orbilia javanica TaxID=47235 RepID=A0AAN8NDM4_9PEZI
MSTAGGKRRLDVREYTVGWVCALPVEHAAATSMLDEEHEDPPYSDDDTNIYTLGRMLGHNVVIVCLPAGLIGSASATAAAIEMKAKFPGIQFGFLVGVGGGVPSAADIRLGDVVISQPHLQHGGVVQYDFGKHCPGGFQRTGFLNTPPKYLLNAVSKLISNHIRGKNTVQNHLAAATSMPVFSRQNAGEDILFKPTYKHVEGAGCSSCKREETIERAARASQDYVTHYGTIASGSSLIRDAQTRDRLSSELDGAVCFEMEATGLMNHFPCLVIRGICDYADSHKNKAWQPYAAATAASCAKELLSVIPIIAKTQVEGTGVTLHNDSIFLQQRLLVREDIISTLRKTFCQNGSARVVLHGLPGMGKSTMARYFAYEKRDEMTVLWITASSKETITEGFEGYAQQVLGEGCNISQPVSIIRQFLSKNFNGRWLLILDGLDDINIDVEQFTFNGLPDAKVLITTRSTQVASRIEATYVLQVNSLDQDKARDLLSKYLNPIPRNGNPAQDELHPEEINARAHLVQELGGLPLAISIIGAALRNEDGIQSMSCKAYLSWPAQIQDSFLAQDPEFSNYPSSVWKAFSFAFQGILSDQESNQHVASMAVFVASCENAWSIAEYFQLCRRFPNFPMLESIGFLGGGFFELAMRKLAAINMVTWSWPSGRPPFIEMHPLVRRWIRRTEPERVHSYTAPKLRLVGLCMYENMVADRVKENWFTALMREITNLVIEDNFEVYRNWNAMPDIIVPFILYSHKLLRQSIDSMPAGLTKVSPFSEVSESLRLEINPFCHSTVEEIKRLGLENIVELTSILVTKCKELIEHSDSIGFLDINDILSASRAKIPPFMTDTTEHGHQFQKSLSHTGLIQDIVAGITAEMERCLDAYLKANTIIQAPQRIHEGSDSIIQEWMADWGLDIKEIIRRTLEKVFIRHCRDWGGTELGKKPEVTTNLWGHRNAFFAALYWAVKRSINDYFEPLRVLHIQVALGGYGCSPVFLCQVLAVRLKGVEDFFVTLVTGHISHSLMGAARAGFMKAFTKTRPQHISERLAREVFSTKGVIDLFRNQCVPNDFEIFDTTKDSNGPGEPTYIRSLDKAQEYILRAMKIVYDGQGSILDVKHLVRLALPLTAECNTNLLDTTPAISPELYMRNFTKHTAALVGIRSRCLQSLEILNICRFIVEAAEVASTGGSLESTIKRAQVEKGRIVREAKKLREGICAAQDKSMTVRHETIERLEEEGKRFKEEGKQLHLRIIMSQLRAFQQLKEEK